jgi:PAS domain-containing protein
VERRPRAEEIICQSPDGSRSPIRVNAAPIYDDAGRIIAAVATFDDVTDQKKAAEEREALLKSVERERSRLRAVLDSLPVAVAIADCKGRLIELNQLASTLWRGDPPPRFSP